MNDILHVYLVIIHSYSTLNSKEKCCYAGQVHCVKYARIPDFSDPYKNGSQKSRISAYFVQWSVIKTAD